MTPTNVVTSMPVSSCFRTLFASKRFHGCETLLEPALKHFHPNFALILDKLSWRKSPLLRSKILGLFGNTLTAEYMFSPHRWEKLRQKVQMLLSPKQRTFSLIFIALSESAQTFADFEKKD